MKRRMLIMVVCVIVFLTIVGGMKSLQIRAAMAGQSFQPPPEAVTSVVAREQQWEQTLAIIGSVESVQGVTVSADLPGVVRSIDFESGRRVSKGEILVQLDTSQEQAQLAAAEARLNLARVDLARYKELSELEVAPRSAYDHAAAEAKQAEALVGEIRATIGRKVIRAPFSGVLGIRQVNLGQYLEGGAEIVQLQSLDPIYVNFAVPQQEVSRLHLGDDVRITAEGTAIQRSGEVTAIDSKIDESTRNVQVQATLSNRSGELRPGMFVETLLVSGSTQAVIAIPASAISYAPFGDSVFVIEDMKDKDGKAYRGVRQQFVKLGSARGDQIAVLSGIKPGEEVVSAGAFKLRNGAAVKVDNSVQPPNDLAPKPENS
ncbi:MAG: efflux RND transporter periplasmic adaptor subunit [Acidobacteria bacterium]|nr:efflux RND transporter periplasmic adaptor subunit [Acidobacteriota bacterium]